MDLERITQHCKHFKNWSGTYECHPERYFIPETLDEIREILYLAKTEKKRIRVVGCGNSPSDICCSDDYMINMNKFDHILHIDHEHCLVTVQAGINLSKLNQLLDQNGLAMPVLGSISDSSLAGVISVGTHGTGFRTGIIADYVLSIRLITPSGDVITCSQRDQHEIFNSVLCGLGALGIILEVTIRCERKFYLYQLSYPSRLDSVLDRLDENVESCDYYRFLFFPHTDFVSVSITNRLNSPFFKYLKLRQISKRFQQTDNSRFLLNGSHQEEEEEEHPSSILEQQDELESSGIIDISDYKLSSEKNYIEKLIDWLINYGIGYHFIQFSYWISTYVPPLVPFINKFAFWFLYSYNQVKLDISYKVFNFECLFNQHVNEWCIPRNRTAEALRDLKRCIEHMAKKQSFYAHFPIEVRFAPASPIYLSPSFGRDSTYINIISYKPYGREQPNRQEYWRRYEEIMKQHGGRPHWAKDHHETAEDLVKMYPYFRSWCQIRRRMDPTRLFFNSYMDRIFSTFPNPTIASKGTSGMFISQNHNQPATSTPIITNINGGDNLNQQEDSVSNHSEQNNETNNDETNQNLDEEEEEEEEEESESTMTVDVTSSTTSNTTTSTTGNITKNLDNTTKKMMEEDGDHHNNNIKEINPDKSMIISSPNGHMSIEKE